MDVRGDHILGPLTWLPGDAEIRIDGAVAARPRAVARGKKSRIQVLVEPPPLMLELDEQDQLRKTYRICGVGFGILSLALILACCSYILLLAFRFTHLGFFLDLLNSSFFHWIGIPVTWASLIGTTLLWGRWDSPSWQRRVGWLLVMSLADVVLWAMDQGTELKLINRDFGHDWLRNNLGQALGWAELAIMTTLACDYLDHLGVGQVREAAKSTRSLLSTGAAIWMLNFCSRTSWESWPLQRLPMRFVEEEYLMMGVVIIQTIALIQVTALTFSAARESSRVLADLDREDPYRELFGPRSDFKPVDPHEVESSRSRERT